MSKELYEATRKLCTVEGERAYHLAVFGDALAEREGYKEHRGMDAIHYYLVQKYSWPLSQVRGMSIQDTLFLLEEEMHGWSLPKEARLDDNASTRAKRAPRSK